MNSNSDNLHDHNMFGEPLLRHDGLHSIPSNIEYRLPSDSDDHSQSDTTGQHMYSPYLHDANNMQLLPPTNSGMVKSSSSGYLSSHQQYDMEDGDDENDTSVCQAGAEQTGRWTKKEHELFLEGLQKYGKEWKKVAANVKTRTIVQTRTHAQKYFQKAQSRSGEDGEMGVVKMRTAANNSATKKVRPNNQSTPNMVPHASHFHTQALVQPYDSGYGEYMNTDYYAPTFPENSYDDDYFYYDMELPSRGSSRTGSLPRSSSNGGMMTLAEDNIPYIPNTGAISYSSDSPDVMPMNTAPNTASSSVMSIHRVIDIPPPSPASCGKRKAAELAAAQGLAAAIASTNATSSQEMESGVQALAMMRSSSHHTKDIAAATRKRTMGSLSIINPDTLPSFKSNDQTVPTTPWDGELKQLESQQRQGSSGYNTVVPVLSTTEQNEFISKVCNAVLSGDAALLGNILLAAKTSELLAKTPATAKGTETEAEKPPPVALFVSPSAKKGSMSFPSPHNSSSTRQLDYSVAIAEMINRVNDKGESVLMIACSDMCTSRYSQNIILDLCKALLEYGASSGLTNMDGKTCLHLLAERGYEIVAKLLIHRGCPINGVDVNGDSACHIAVRNGHINFIEVLCNCGVNCHIHNNAAKCPMDCAVDIPELNIKREDIRKMMLTSEPRLRTLILYHEDCLEHSARKQSDWEGPDRLCGIMKTLYDTNIFPSHMIEISNQFDKAQVELLSRVHSPEYIAFVNTLSKKIQQNSDSLNSNTSTVPFTPQVQMTMFHKSEDMVKAAEFCDTSFSAGTLKAARRAAGAVAHAVDMVLLGRNRNAFCVVRPPGHHAGYRGLLDGAKSCGFCIFNNVAAGALHALEAHNCERVAIIDIDIHHGNGTEDIVRRYPHPSRLFFFSLHLFDKEETYEFFPGSGATDDTMHNIINVPIAPMWTETLSHGTRSKHTTTTSSTTGRDAYKQAITQRLIPALRAFGPDLILLSTGFDPASGDVGNLRNNGLANGQPSPGMNLRPWDFEWVTTEMIKIADLCCNGRLVSVLEGGYGANPPPVGGHQRLAAAGRTSANKGDSPVPSQDTTSVTLDRSILSKSAAAHVLRLCDPYGIGSPPPS